MIGIAQSFNTYVRHTTKYYARYFDRRSVALLVLFTAAIVLLVAVANVVVTHAGIAKWLVDDVINDDVFNGYFNYMLNADAPAESNNRFHLQMPMMLEGYLDVSNYVSNGAGDPSKPKIDDAVGMTTQPSFFNANDFEMAPADEWEAAAADATEFIESRPPQSGLK